MRHVNGIFLNFERIGKLLLGAVCAISIFTGSAFAASNGCDDTDKNDRIHPDLALCSVHAYNVGLTKNPSTPAEKQAMDEVVALKTTIMTQQMKKQYDYLETTVKRFKTQLEKSILTAKMQAAGAATESGTSGGTSSDRNIILSNAENCRIKTSTSAMLQCLQGNLQVIRLAVSSGNMGQANRQLKNDLEVAELLKIGTETKNAAGSTDISVTGCVNVPANRNDMNNCIDNFSVAIMTKLEENQRASQQGQNRQSYN